MTAQGSYAVQTGELVQLSAQQLIDCVQVANGCEGGDEAKVTLPH